MFKSPPQKQSSALKSLNTQILARFTFFLFHKVHGTFVGFLLNLDNYLGENILLRIYKIYTHTESTQTIKTYMDVRLSFKHVKNGSKSSHFSLRICCVLNIHRPLVLSCLPCKVHSILTRKKTIGQAITK